MSNKTVKGKSKTGYFAKYTTSKLFETNRVKKLTKLLKEHPNNKQIANALKDIRNIRTTPKVETWSHSDIATAKLFKQFTGKFDKGVLLRISDQRAADSHAAAIRTRNQNMFDAYKAPKFTGHSMFALKERAHSGNGLRVWI